MRRVLLLSLALAASAAQAVECPKPVPHKKHVAAPLCHCPEGYHTLPPVPEDIPYAPEVPGWARWPEPVTVDLSGPAQGPGTPLAAYPYYPIGGGSYARVVPSGGGIAPTYGAPRPTRAPEIGTSGSTAALTLLFGALAVIRSRK